MKRILVNLKSLHSAKKRSLAVETSEEPIFDQQFYKEITSARLQHFESLSLPLKGKTLIDVGSGIGRFSASLETQGADVFCVDGRSENIEKLREFYPSRKCAVVDVESSDLLRHGQFDVVFCYGLLYHLSNPYGFIENASKICKETMIIETCIMDADEPIVRLVPEDQNNVTQSLHPMGCRPSISYVEACLRANGFDFVYKPILPPKHPQFEYKLANDYSHLRQGHLIRAIFIASRTQISSNSIRLI